MTVSIVEAQERLPELIAIAEKGEPVVIAQGDGRTIRLVPATQHSAASSAAQSLEPTQGRTERIYQPGDRVGGQNLLGITYIAPEFDAPMTPEELAEWGY